MWCRRAPRPCPYIVLETLAAGKPMMATAVGGVPEIFGTATTGLMTPDVASISASMIKALGNEAGWIAAMPGIETLKHAWRRRDGPHGRGGLSRRLEAPEWLSANRIFTRRQ
ncbi:MAG: glycosyltransferase family 4 protein [Phyllobacteriaceae bacterium]|nr:glycosyltransferase family 4 protein [Phyllobacteriaceae bacterium]